MKLELEVPAGLLGKIGLGVFVGFLGLMIAFSLWFGAVGIIEDVSHKGRDVRIVPWSPGTTEAPSPYVCFAAMKGNKDLLALDCLDVSLSQRSVSVPSQTTTP